ncbi:type II toxin-antitoxin system PemK/MazF family toxin [Phosphitispora fastidiosa]|uniref:type II toxin-antitoxin system PemK/MazF family toxin n=1 Tax=Phosphitispora fastidiosa TaxID=2837202 RepID=UPI001E5F25A9|nr:type II toxin-antitoxin system PemK/MazF family toxin [Phosphitispora fastidiosa]MBU7007380.1 mRNA interferase MazF [Phosphitispora fastidiosa]
MVVHQYEIFWVNLDPTMGSEIKKTRPCLIISPDEMNRHLNTVLAAPMTTKTKNYPTRIKVNFAGKTGWIALDQIRCIDKIRLVNKAEELDQDTITLVKNKIMEMLVE